jgi:hypothetical protein
MVAIQATTAFVRTRGLVRLPGAGESAAGLIAAALVVVAWYGVGALLVRLLEGRWCAATPRAVATACAFGAAIWSVAWFFLGLVGAYRTAPAFIALLVGVALAALAMTRMRGGSRNTPAPRGASSSAYVPWTLIAIAVLTAGVGALAPPTAKDTLQYHLALPRAFVTEGRLTVVSGNIWGYLPLGVEINGVWAMLVGRVVNERVGEAAFGATTFAFLPLLLAFVYGWTAERGAGRAWAVTAAAVVATVPVVVEVAASGYVDLALALYVAIATHAVARWWDTRDSRALLVLGIALGSALSVKLTALFPFVLLGLMALVGAQRAGRGPGVVVAAVAGGTLVAAPWYLRTWWLTGSPLFPYYLDIWPGQAPGWDAARSAMIRAFNLSYGGDKDVLGVLVLPLRLSLMSQHEVPAFYESVLGVTLLVAAPMVAWALWRRRLAADAVLAAVVAAMLFGWWTATAQVLRYLVPVVALAAVVAVRAASALDVGDAARWLRVALLVPTSAGLGVVLAWWLASAPMLSVLGAEPRDEYLARRLDYYPYYRVINAQLAPDARVWLINVRRDTYHLDRAYVGDYLFEDYTVQRELRAGHGAAELREWARAHGVTHVFVRHDALFDLRRSSLLDDSLPPEANFARLARFKEFLTQNTRILKSDQKFALVDLQMDKQ